MFVSEEKLPIEVAKIDCIEVNDMDLAETCEHEVLEQFASNPPGANHQDSSLHLLLATRSTGRIAAKKQL